MTEFTEAVPGPAARVGTGVLYTAPLPPRTSGTWPIPITPWLPPVTSWAPRVPQMQESSAHDRSWHMAVAPE